MTMALSYLFAAVNHKLILTVTVGDKEGYVSESPFVYKP
jgi:hypothetical protein